MYAVSMSKTVLFQTIQFSISTQFSSIWPIDRTLIRCYHSRPEWTWERLQWRGTPHSPKLQHYWNLTIRLFNDISRTLVGGGLTPLQRSTQCLLQPHLTGQLANENQSYYEALTVCFLFLRRLRRKILFKRRVWLFIHFLFIIYDLVVL